MVDKKYLLIVDDDEDIRITLSSELSGEGYSVRTASDGDEAISIIQNDEIPFSL